MTDIMLDLETWGTRPGSALRSIGAVTFDPNSEGTGSEFYVNISDMSCELAGLYVDPNTVAWWERQSKAAQDALLINQQPLHDALWSFTNWWSTMGGERIWSHGANFDQPILEAAYVACGHPGAPWSFWNSRCTRTLFDIAGVDTRKLKSNEVAHNALHDAKNQARAVQACMKHLFPSTTVDNGVFQ